MKWYHFRRVFRAALTTALSFVGLTTGASADLTFTPFEKAPAILVTGTFSPDDDLAPFVRMARERSARFVSFDSTGGNPYKAMALGRVIRRLGLSTVQVKQLNCVSACSLAFLGGIYRLADAGSIGIHQSSLSAEAKVDTKDAVSAVQSLTAAMISYTVEMGVDPALIETALKYDSDDMRFLSKSEMRRFRVTTDDDTNKTPRTASRTPPSATTSPPPMPASPPLANPREDKPIPTARSGRVRHPKGGAPLKYAADVKSPDLTMIKNGTRVSILSTEPSWYRAEAAGKVGYLHHTWVAVDQFPHTDNFDDRFIQVKSFASYPNVEEYVRRSSLDLAVYLTTNGWYAITLAESADHDRAMGLLTHLKSEGRVPADSFLSFGNTYARKVCCAKK